MKSLNVCLEHFFISLTMNHIIICFISDYCICLINTFEKLEFAVMNSIYLA